MNDTTSTQTFLGLIRSCGRIEVPRIQRDYAQGRASQKSVREAFLAALQEALSLPPDDASLPMNLDFVYGDNVMIEGLMTFQPLDGQQRLTTLCLLHWYAAWLDDAGERFRDAMLNEGRSRFTYSVRPSSQQFFDQLMAHAPEVVPAEVESVRSHIEDQPWFFLYWRMDPTINAALGMLDAIHARFKSLPDIYKRLSDGDRPAITFHLLLLKHFGLSDDLYIKMNARGKPLTPFEVFKARLEDWLRQRHSTETRVLNSEVIPLADYFTQQLDTQWTDFFWASCTVKEGNSTVFDREALNLLWALARATLDPKRVDFIDVSRSLASSECPVSFEYFRDRELLSLGFVQRIISLLDTWSRDRSVLAPVLEGGRFNEHTFFNAAAHRPDNVSYEDLALFAAFSRYLRRNEGEVHDIEIREWMRVIFNLTTNTDCDLPEEFQRCARGGVALLKHGRNILRHLADDEPKGIGFSQQQLGEEVLKAKLMLSHEGWRDRIEASEHHGYFLGQITFLLDFCGACELRPGWTTEQHQISQARFDDYLIKANAMFDAKGLRSTKGHLWQRALLACGDYLLNRGQNRSFCTDPRNYPDSWQKFLLSANREHLKTLWDRLDSKLPLEPQLECVIDEGLALDDWRAQVLRYPHVIDYCWACEMRFDGPEVYLLRRQQMNGTHAELYSYALDLDLRADTKQFFPLLLQEYQSTSGNEAQPHVRFNIELAGNQTELAISSWDSAFFVELHSVPADPKINGALRALGFDQHEDADLALNCARDGVKALLAKIAAI